MKNFDLARIFTPHEWRLNDAGAFFVSKIRAASRHPSGTERKTVGPSAEGLVPRSVASSESAHRDRFYDIIGRAARGQQLQCYCCLLWVAISTDTFSVAEPHARRCIAEAVHSSDEHERDGSTTATFCSALTSVSSAASGRVADGSSSSSYEQQRRRCGGAVIVSASTAVSS